MYLQLFGRLGGSCILFGLLSSFSCMSSKKGKELEQGLFTAQTRILQLERALLSEQQQAENRGKEAYKKIASNIVSLDKIQYDIRKLQGEVEALRVGVETGEMPGTNPETPSVGKQLRDVALRLDALEDAQVEVLQQVENLGSQRTSSRRGRAVSDKVGGLRSDFSKKRYKYVILDAPEVIENSSGVNKEEAEFLLAESLFKLGRIQAAAVKFDDFLQNNPSKKFVPKAQLRIGDCFRFLGEHDMAMHAYRKLLSEYPKSDEAATAEKRLADLKEKES